MEVHNPNGIITSATRQENMATSIMKEPIQFATSSHSIDMSGTAPQSKSGTISITKSGYYPIGITGFDAGGAHATNLFLNRATLSNVSVGNATLNWQARDFASGETSTATITVKVLWYKV